MSVIMICGNPGSGKTRFAKDYRLSGYKYLSRDKEGGRTFDLLPKFEHFLKECKDVVLDNTFMTAEKRKPFIELAHKYNTSIKCEYIDTPIEECQINVLHRMYRRYNKIFYTEEDINNHDEASEDPKIFPIHVLVHFSKNFEKPQKDEGFNSFERIKFQRDTLGDEFCNKALIFNYDRALRNTISGKKYPVSPDDIKITKRNKDWIKNMIEDNGDAYLLGVSNHSGVEKKKITFDKAKECFEKTNELLNIDIKYHFCPHIYSPIRCYCRKPQSGIGVYLINKYKLDPNQCTFIGAMSSDKTFAKRLGFNYFDQFYGSLF